MPNVLITNRCNQNCSYCFAQKEMKKKTEEMPFSSFERVLDFLKQSGDENLRLLGGEPTLHFRFKDIIKLAFDRKFSIQIFTNGLFGEDILDFLISRGCQIRYSFNMNSKEKYSSQNYKQLLKNLEKISVFKNVLVGVVIYDNNFNLDYLLKIIKKYQIKSIALRVANPTFLVSGNTLIKEIKKISKGFGVGFGCGLSKKLFNEKQRDVLKEVGVFNSNYGCGANSGKFDIGVDLSVFRCFPLACWKNKNLFDFKNTKEIEQYFSSKMKDYQSKNLKENFIQQGPCFANSLK